MTLLTYRSGDCGLGYYSSFMLVNLLVLIAFLPNMIVILSWIATESHGLAFVPMVYENMFVIPMWVSGILAVIPGVIAAYADSHAKRTVSLNAWAFLVGLFAILVISAGIYLTYFIASTKEILTDAVDAAAKAGARKAGLTPFVRGSASDRAYERAKEYGLSVSYYLIWKNLPYPLSAFFFLHWQVGVTAFAFCVVPSILALWAFYHALGNRNYFASKPARFNDVAVSDGPLYDDSDAEPESDKQSDYDDEDSEVEESVPLSKRYVENNASQRTLYQGEDPSPTAGRRGHVTGRKAV